MFTIHQVSRDRYTYWLPNIIRFPDLNVVIDSVHQQVYEYLSLKEVSKSIKHIQALYSNTTVKAKAYHELFSELLVASGA